MSATADRPDDPKRAFWTAANDSTPREHDDPTVQFFGGDFTIQDGNGNKKRFVRKTPETVRANRALVCHIFGCPDELLADVLEHSLKRIDE